MYSKPKPTPEHEFRIPENYSGNAFQSDNTTPSAPIEYPVGAPETVTSEASSEETSTNVALTILPANHEKANEACKKSSPFSSLLPPRFTGSHGGLLGDIGIEELLIIGILILLSQSETDDDILLLLMLLLFYK